MFRFVRGYSFFEIARVSYADNSLDASAFEIPFQTGQERKDLVVFRTKESTPRFRSLNQKAAPGKIPVKQNTMPQIQ